MVLFMVKWDIHPDKTEAYLEWLKTSIPRTVGGPGVVEFRAYRGISGGSQVMATYEFANLEDWTRWYAHEDCQQVLSELYTLAQNVKTEIWWPSPTAPTPIRPGK